MNEAYLIYFSFLYILPGIVSFFMYKDMENDWVMETPRYVRILIRLSYIILWPIYMSVLLIIIGIWAIVKFFKTLIE